MIDRMKLPARAKAGLVLRELLAVTSVVLFLAFLIAPMRRTAENTRDSAGCINNLKQLAAAWLMYADENSGRLVENYHGGGTVGQASNPRSAPWAVGWLDWATSPDNTNTLYLRDPKYARLSPYFRTEQNIHKCPADIYLSSAQKRRGWEERVRSYSLNITLGFGNALTGPWDPIYKQCASLDQLQNPGASESSVFIDEHPDSMNDPSFFPPRSATWVDVPGNLHRGAGAISFADGHVALHMWRGPHRTARVMTMNWGGTASVGDPDLSWVSYHSQRQGPEHH